LSEPGLDLHEWETRWAALQELAEDAPARKNNPPLGGVELERTPVIDAPVVTHLTFRVVE
jgi:hypothetical protein